MPVGERTVFEFIMIEILMRAFDRRDHRVSADAVDLPWLHPSLHTILDHDHAQRARLELVRLLRLRVPWKPFVERLEPDVIGDAVDEGFAVAVAGLSAKGHEQRRRHVRHLERGTTIAGARPLIGAFKVWRDCRLRGHILRRYGAILEAPPRHDDALVRARPSQLLLRQLREQRGLREHPPLSHPAICKLIVPLRQGLQAVPKVCIYLVHRLFMLFIAAEVALYRKVSNLIYYLA